MARPTHYPRATLNYAYHKEGRTVHSTAADNMLCVTNNRNKSRITFCCILINTYLPRLQTGVLLNSRSRYLLQPPGGPYTEHQIH
jgi:hypothetical protein